MKMWKSLNFKCDSLKPLYHHIHEVPFFVTVKSNMLHKKDKKF